MKRTANSTFPEKTPGLRRLVDWGSLAPLRIRASMVAEGVYAGAHRSARKGAGVEFGGHRAYTPGDDLRWLDVRSLLRHDHLLVRQFETETDRALRLVVDATASMGYRGASAPAAKVAWASLVAAALARVAIRSGDPVGLGFIGGSPQALGVPVSGGREAFERVVDALEGQTAEGDALSNLTMLDRALAALARSARRGSVVVVLSDLLDLPPEAADRISALATRGRVVVVVQVLDPDGVGRLIRIAVEEGRATRPKIKLGICGEHGGEPRSVAFCHQIGLDYVSCSPYRVPIARLAAAHAALADVKA